MGKYLQLQEIGIASNGVTIASVDEKIKNLDKDRQDEADLALMQEGLAALKHWCYAPERNNSDKKKAYYVFFENTMLGAFCRYRKSKTATWDIKKNWKRALCVALSPVLSGVAAMPVEAVLKRFTENAEAYSVAKVIPVAIVLGTVFCLVQMYLEWTKNKNDKETWVRHSACYSRLNLALSTFALSAQTEQDYEILVASTHAILEQNLDQFVMNMSAHGMAKRP